MRIFHEAELGELLEGQRMALQREVLAEDSNRLLNANETAYTEYLIGRYRIEPLAFDWDGVYMTEREEIIPARRSRADAFGHTRDSLRQVITYHISFRGDKELLRRKPLGIELIVPEVRVEPQTVALDIVNWDDNLDQIKHDAHMYIDAIKSPASRLADEVEGFNAGLEEFARKCVQGRKAVLLKQASIVAALGVPVRKAGQVPATFAVPVAPRKLIIKPSAPSTGYIPHPTLDDSVYQEMLRIVHEAGVEMERHPSIYGGKDEEALRDYFIMALSPHFESATGETFNKTGKTDILIRHEKCNVFVAECKFWKGMAAFNETIEQLMGYLTWRDSKAAVICFVRNKELQPVLQQIESETPKHPCFVKYNGTKVESWFSYEFHLKDDQTRGVQVAVLCFHFPQEEKAPLAGRQRRKPSTSR